MSLDTDGGFVWAFLWFRFEFLLEWWGLLVVADVSQLALVEMGCQGDAVGIVEINGIG